ncbi:MAG: hypothetical protein ACRDA3_07415 [Peptostreptococcaceae bacterium]
MSQINRLYRNFIILQEDERGHSNSNDKTLSGYSKIEAKGDKCKISFYAQNLRNDSGDYSIMLICNKKDVKKLIDLGKITISEGGKAEITREYFVDNIAGLDLSFDKISGAAIAKMRDGVPIFIMCGFINGEQPTDNWKNYKIIKSSDGSKQSKSRPDIEVKESDKRKDKKKHENKKVEEVISTEHEEEISQQDTEDLVKEEERKEEEIKEEERNEEEIEDMDRKKSKKSNDFDEYEAEIKKSTDAFEINGSVGEYFEGIARGFEHRKDAYSEIKHCKWYQVPVNDLYEMCNMSNYNKYTVAYYPMLNYYPYIRKHGHFMLGYKCDKEGNLRYIVYGVPGKKDREEQPYEGKTGFVTWISDDDENRDGMGCWLMFYDFRNSTVVVPMQ